MISSSATAPGCGRKSSGLDKLTQHGDVTAIFAYNDLLALGALRACAELGRRVPQDCAVIGFDDIPPADWVSPRLTTVRVDKVALGQQAVNLLLTMLETPHRPCAPITVQTALVLRESA